MSGPGLCLPPCSALPVDGDENLVVFREAVLLLLAEHQAAVGNDLKDAAAGGYQPGLVSVPGSYRIRQTGGVGQVVSDLAVFDGDAHGNSSRERPFLQLVKTG